MQAHQSGVVALILDPGLAGARRLARTAFGRYGSDYLGKFSQALPGGWVVLVGIVRRKPARVMACRPEAAELGVSAGWDMAQRLAGNSTWFVHLRPGPANRS